MTTTTHLGLNQDLEKYAGEYNNPRHFFSTLLEERKDFGVVVFQKSKSIFYDDELFFLKDNEALNYDDEGGFEVAQEYKDYHFLGVY